jgi:uncharacterized membrane protein YfcA
VATQAVCQTLTHLSKIIVFTYIGFQFFDWWMVLLFMLAATIAGSFVGVKILEKIPQAAFIKILKGIVVILAARLIYKGLVLLHFVG